MNRRSQEISTHNRYSVLSSLYICICPLIITSRINCKSRKMKLYTCILFFLALLLVASAEQCGRQAGGALCPNALCCSQHGWCGETTEYCGTGCQSQCRPPGPTPGVSGVGSIISEGLFNQMLKYKNDPRCPSNGFYTYNAFITAARSFNGFGTSGDVNTRKRELAAFLAQTSHETTG